MASMRRTGTSTLPDFVDPLTGQEYRIDGGTTKRRLMPMRRPLFGAARSDSRQLPSSVDLRKWMTPVEHQGSTISCVANALAGAYEYLIMKNKGLHVDVSRLFIYYNGRLKSGFTEKNMSDSGCNLSAAIEALMEFGCCKESNFPFVAANINKKPSPQCYDEAYNHRVVDAGRVPIQLDEMKQYLADGYPFTFGFLACSSFKAAGYNGGIVEMPDIDNDDLDDEHGSHAMLAVGYCDTTRCFIARNSWGPNWGDHGYCYMPYDYLTDPMLCLEAEAIKSLSSDNSQISPRQQGARNSMLQPQYCNIPAPSNNIYYSNPGKRLPTRDSKGNYTREMRKMGRPESLKTDRSDQDVPIILWIDQDNEEHSSIERELKRIANATVIFYESFVKAEDYIVNHKARLERSSLFQIICRSRYKEENKTPTDLLNLLDYLSLSHIPVTVYTRHKGQTENYLEEQAKRLFIKDWRKRFFVTTESNDMLSKVLQNIPREE